MIQLDFFVEKTKEEFLEEELENLRKSHDKIRKSLFARHGELAKKYMELHERMDIIERYICKPELALYR